MEFHNQEETMTVIFFFLAKQGASNAYLKNQLGLCQAERETLLKTAVRIGNSGLNKLDYS